MIVKDLNITEFRGIKSCKSPIHLSNFNVLIGRNNSGKSTILEALSLLPSPKMSEYITDGDKIDFISNLHYRKQTPKNRTNLYKTLIYQYAGTSLIEYNRIGEKVFNIIIKENQVIPNFGVNEMLLEIIDEIRGRKPPKQLEYIDKFLEMIKKPSALSVLFIPSDTQYIKEMNDKINSLKDVIIKRGIHVQVAKSLNKCVDDEYSEILFGDPLRIRKVFSDNFTYIRISDLGSGAEKLIKIMLLIESITPELILIDDIEAGLHPTMINIFLKWLINLGSQVVISTHSIDVLYKLTEINPLDCNVLFLKKSCEDNLKYDKLSLDEIEDLLNANTDPRKFNF